MPARSLIEAEQSVSLTLANGKEWVDYDGVLRKLLRICAQKVVQDFVRLRKDRNETPISDFDDDEAMHVIITWTIDGLSAEDIGLSEEDLAEIPTEVWDAVHSRLSAIL